MQEVFEVILVDGTNRWHVGVVADDEAETDLLLRERGAVLVFGGRPALEHYLQEHDLEPSDELPDEIDLDLGGWLTAGHPLPTVAEVAELWNLLYDDPVVGRQLSGERLGEAYDDLDGGTEEWFEVHGREARPALAEAVALLRKAFRRA